MPFNVGHFRTDFGHYGLNRTQIGHLQWYTMAYNRILLRNKKQPQSLYFTSFMAVLLILRPRGFEPPTFWSVAIGDCPILATSQGFSDIFSDIIISFLYFFCTYHGCVAVLRIYI